VFDYDSVRRDYYVFKSPMGIMLEKIIVDDRTLALLSKLTLVGNGKLKNKRKLLSFDD
jgi:hypothetical protein